MLHSWKLRIFYFQWISDFNVGWIFYELNWKVSLNKNRVNTATVNAQLLPGCRSYYYCLSLKFSCWAVMYVPLP